MTASAAGTARAACPRQATGPRRSVCCSARTRRDPGEPGAVGAAVSSGEEDDMSETTPALDEAFERMAAASFELPNGFVNHGAMACEALAVLDCADDIDSWARRFARAGGASVDPVVPAGFEWRQALGDCHRLPEWIGYFTQAIDDDGWPAVVATWRAGPGAWLLGGPLPRRAAGQPAAPRR